MPITEITFSDGDDALGGGPANTSGNMTPTSTPAFSPVLSLQSAPAGPGVTDVSLSPVPIPATPSRTINITGGTGISVFNEGQAIYGDCDVTVADYTVNVTGNVTTMTWNGTGSFAPGCTFTLVNTATIYGTGGAGGAAGQNGSIGGTALQLDGYTVSINNGGGNIWGGGGGGGGGRTHKAVAVASAALASAMFASGCGGGGGAGPNNAAGGAGSATVTLFATNYVNKKVVIRENNSGQQVVDTAGAYAIGVPADCRGTVRDLAADGIAGSALGNGAGGTIALDSDFQQLDNGSGAAMAGGNGGNGGDFGQNGSAGTAGTYSSFAPAPTHTTTGPGTGGLAGFAIRLLGGTANFTSGGAAPNVKGAVA